jgi:ATP-dependent helicase/nuclease subunit B
VVGGLNEGVWPAKASADRFMSRVMKSGMALEPPERRIGQSAHDFEMALGVRALVLSRAARAGDAPAVASRWLQRLQTFAGEAATAAMRARGDGLLALARSVDGGQESPPARQPCPAPPLAARPRHFSVTEIETLRRDPYAIYARRILRLAPLDPLLCDPGPAERGTLFHAILHRFALGGVDPRAPEAAARLIDAGRACFAEAGLPDDVAAVWWPRFERLAASVIDWERGRAGGVLRRVAEARAAATPVGASGVTLSGYADRIDMRPSGLADIIDYKTGTSPSKVQAHRLVAPQLPLEAALLARGAFAEPGRLEAADLLYVRLKANGEVVPESILSIKGSNRAAGDLAAEAWERLERLIAHYASEDSGYLSRALPLREGDTDGDYDHLARVLEWSAGRREGGEA